MEMVVLNILLIMFHETEISYGGLTQLYTREVLTAH